MSEKHHGDGVVNHLVGNLPHGGGGSGSFQRIRLVGGFFPRVACKNGAEMDLIWDESSEKALKRGSKFNKEIHLNSLLIFRHSFVFSGKYTLDKTKMSKWINTHIVKKMYLLF